MTTTQAPVSFLQQVLDNSLPLTSPTTPAPTPTPAPVPDITKGEAPTFSQKPITAREKARLKAQLGPAFHEGIDAIPTAEEPKEERLDELLSASQVNTQSVNAIMEQAKGNPLRVSNSVNGFMAAGDRGSCIFGCVLLLNQEVKTIETEKNRWVGFRGSYKATKYNDPLYFDLRILDCPASRPFIEAIEQAQNEGRQSLQVSVQGHMAVTGTPSKPFFALWLREEYGPAARVVTKKVFNR